MPRSPYGREYGRSSEIGWDGHNRVQACASESTPGGSRPLLTSAGPAGQRVQRHSGAPADQHGHNHIPSLQVMLAWSGISIQAASAGLFPPPFPAFEHPWATPGRGNDFVLHHHFSWFSKRENLDCCPLGKALAPGIRDRDERRGTGTRRTIVPVARFSTGVP